MSVEHATARQFMGDVSALGMLQVLGRVQGLVLVPLITKTLGAAAYGVWTQVAVVVSLFTAPVQWQLSEALVRFVPGQASREIQRDHFYSAVALVMAAGAAVAGLCWLLAAAMFDADPDQSVYVAASIRNAAHGHAGARRPDRRLVAAPRHSHPQRQLDSRRNGAHRRPPVCPRRRPGRPRRRRRHCRIGYLRARGRLGVSNCGRPGPHWQAGGRRFAAGVGDAAHAVLLWKSARTMPT